MLGAPDLTDDVWLYGGSLADVRQTILKGRNGRMPAFGEQLDADRVRCRGVVERFLDLRDAGHPSFVCTLVERDFGGRQCSGLVAQLLDAHERLGIQLGLAHRGDRDFGLGLQRVQREPTRDPEPDRDGQPERSTPHGRR